MPAEKQITAVPDWEKIVWEQTPYSGVFICKTEEKQNPNNSTMPLYTLMALKIESEAKIPLHKHNREQGWIETITFPNGGKFEIENNQELKKIETKDPFIIIIKAGEIFGLKNIDPLQPLYFLSKMEPGFTGYAEIEEIKAR